MLGFRAAIALFMVAQITAKKVIEISNADDMAVLIVPKKSFGNCSHSAFLAQTSLVSEDNSTIFENSDYKAASTDNIQYLIDNLKMHALKHYDVLQEEFLTFRNLIDEQTNDLKDQLNDVQNETRDIESKMTALKTIAEQFKNNTEKQISNLIYISTCAQALNGGGMSGVYYLRDPQVNGKPYAVYCEADPNGGPAWTIIQRRLDGSEDFYRSWNEYKQGFGNVGAEYFLGLERIYRLTNGATNELWIKLRDSQGEQANVNYKQFGIGSEMDGYSLRDIAGFSGDVGDSFSAHKGNKFSTFDVDNDVLADGNCAVRSHGAWWYDTCYSSNLNGRYYNASTAEECQLEAIIWRDWHTKCDPLKYTHMAIRPAQRS